MGLDGQQRRASITITIITTIIIIMMMKMMIMNKLQIFSWGIHSQIKRTNSLKTNLLRESSQWVNQGLPPHNTLTPIPLRLSLFPQAWGMGWGLA
jgi:hypothetical protein